MTVVRSALCIASLIIGLIPLLGQAAPVSVKNLRMWQAPDHTRLVFDLSGSLEHRLFSLKNPARIVIDMQHARLEGQLPALDYSGPLLTNIRIGERSRNELRVVLDLKKQIRPRTFILKPYGQYGHRLVIDLYFDSPEKVIQPTKTSRTRPYKRRNIVIAVDAGHGGEDPGAVGRRYRTREKRVVMSIARQVAKRINDAPGMRAVLTRKGDYFISLRRRTQIAKNAGADLFVSIHADSMPGRHGRRVKGSSVYALSQRGATSETARILANKENASDFIGGSYADKDNTLVKVLIDLSQTATIAASLRMGKDMLGTLRSVGPVHKTHVAQAGFTVLKSPAIPSILVETAFISNPNEERKLRSKAFQRRMAASIVRGLKRYVRRGTVHKWARARTEASPTKSTGAQYHVVSKGDTLTSIARQYKITINALRLANNMTGNKISIGHRLQIP